ncbi:MAG: hypothetical protein Q4B67_03595 [Eubacteriales bacterium]|nr:hypothetical protein [Eubacteriales bacterium]
MAKKLITVELTFENMDFIRIPGQHICDLQIEGITDSVILFGDMAESRKTAANIELAILDSFKCKGRISTDDADIYEDFDKRILEQDICGLRLYYDDNTSEDYFVTWEDTEESEYKNRLQNAEILEDGTIYVTIGN